MFTHPGWRQTREEGPLVERKVGRGVWRKGGMKEEGVRKGTGAVFLILQTPLNRLLPRHRSRSLLCKAFVAAGFVQILAGFYAKNAINNNTSTTVVLTS
jgi:hypothetical protein